VFLSPDDLVPFYAGTYFPKDARYGMPPFAHVLQQVRGFWDARRDDVHKQTTALAEFLHDYDRGESTAAALDDTPIRSALAQIERSFDAEHGGHRGAPKFPHCPEMQLLLELAGDPAPASPEPSSASRKANASAMVELTLARMADGGIHDQLGGGFCRYSVDERWEIPHFEKMLYDNAQLLPLYAALARRAINANAAAGADVAHDRATQSRTTGERWSTVAHELLAWLVREMVAPGGGFFTALDADSEHEEGKFYVWQSAEVRALLNDAEFAVAVPYFGLDRPPNFEQHAWNLIVASPLERIALTLASGSDAVAANLAAAKRKLFDARSRRVRPGLDDKILTANNALMISGIARATRLLDAPPLLGLADNALDFLYSAAWRDGRLFAKAGDDASRFPGYLDDHAFLLDALIECLQCRWNARDLHWALQLADALLERFEDRDHGGFFFTAHDHEALPQRPKPWIDEAAPSGNGIAAHALLRLGHLLGDARYTDAAERTLRAAYSTMQQMPHACPTLLRALTGFLRPCAHVVVRYARADGAEDSWRAALAAAGTAQRVDGYAIPDDAGNLPGLLEAQKYTSGGVAYVCRGTSCMPPVGRANDLAGLLADGA
jgi:uncharacterized protein YyaL (SSP411 family)